MTGRGAFIAAVVLALSSIGFADPGPGPSHGQDGDGHLKPCLVVLAYWWVPDALIALGYPGLDAAQEPQAGAVARSGYTVSVETTGSGAQSTYVSVSGASAASGNGDAWIDAEVVVVTSQGTP